MDLIVPNNMTTLGPKLWRLIHVFALIPHKREDYFMFVNPLQYLIPCVICRNHFSENLKEIKIDNYPDDFSWSYYIHDKVNYDTKKSRPNKIQCTIIMNKTISYPNLLLNDLMWVLAVFSVYVDRNKDISDYFKSFVVASYILFPNSIYKNMIKSALNKCNLLKIKDNYFEWFLCLYDSGLGMRSREDLYDYFIRGKNVP